MAVMSIGKDKLLHIGASFCTELIFAAVLPSWLPWTRAALNVVLIGGGKEIYDKTHEGHDAEWADLAADAVGAILGEILWAVIR